MLRSGLVVEKVSDDGLAAKAGIEFGDVLLSWRRGDVGGDLVSPFDLDQVIVEEAPRDVVTLAGRRGEVAMSFELGEGSWGLETRPLLGDQADQALAEAREAGGVEGVNRLQAMARGEERTAVRAWLLVLAAEAAGVDAGGELWAEGVASAGDDGATRALVHERHGKALLAVSRFEEAAAEYSVAVESQPEGSLAAAASLSNLGIVARNRGDLEMAERCYLRALETRERLAPGSLAQAASLNSLGIVARSRGDLEAAEGHHRRALEIRERLAPGSLDVATSLNNLGAVAKERGDLETAERLYTGALEIQERLAPASLGVARSLSNLGVVAQERGVLQSAERYYGRSLEIRKRLAPGSLDVAACLNNLGAVAKERGDLEAAEQYHRQALEVYQRLAPASLDVATSLSNLGTVAQGRGDLETAERYHLRALEIYERIAPGSLAVAASLSNLATVTLTRGDLDAAEGYHRRALEIREQLAPTSLAVAKSLNGLGVVAMNRSDLDGAEGYYRRALEIRERIAPASLAVAASLSNLGFVTEERGELVAAEGYQRRALDIFERLAPGSTNEADSLHELARVLNATGRRPEALATLRRAVAALEAQQRRLGGIPEQLGEFRAQHLDIYRDLVEMLLEEHLPEEAFGVLESARARALLAMLAERDVLAVDVSTELEKERRLANADHDRTMAALGQLAAADEQERLRLLATLDTIRQRQEEIRARVRAASPRLAALRYPESLDLGETQRLLDREAVLLEYALGKDSSHLFVVGPGPDRFAVYPLPIGEDALREDVARVRRLIQRARVEPASDPGQARGDQMTEASRSLSTTLLGPARTEIAASSRVIVVPDGPLNLLPFAALLDPTASYERHLVEAKPISVVASATVLAQLKQQRRPQRQVRLTAFGDPHYPTVTSGEVSPELEQARRSGLSLDPLPATRAEVEGLAELFGGSATLWLGSDATEERAKAVGKEVTVLHFAAHGMVDERRPLSSALALAMPEQPVEGQENGLLQAWEIFEQVHLDADLVVLSACETALGKEVAGEGIVGLTRAFQYAGAASVLASLWSVADESTPELMVRFYTNLKAGMAKDEALRQAQLTFMRGDGNADRHISHPFYWAAFQLYGDWR